MIIRTRLQQGTQPILVGERLNRSNP